jgi:hypothetical protein
MFKMAAFRRNRTDNGGVSLYLKYKYEEQKINERLIWLDCSEIMFVMLHLRVMKLIMMRMMRRAATVDGCELQVWAWAQKQK